MILPTRIPVRTQQLSWSAELPRDWNDHNIFASQYFNALSLIFPVGEKFFIDSVRLNTNENISSELRERIRAFISQEVWHAKAHADFNASLEKLNLPREKCEGRLSHFLEVWKSQHPHLTWLSTTVAFEHVTATLSRDLLARQENCARMHPHFARLWRWHAMEELEHKSVAFDLYRELGGSYSQRAFSMLWVMFRFNWDVTLNFFELMKADGQLGNWRVWLDGVRTLYGLRQGWFWRTLPDILAFFRRDFHPDQQDDRVLLQETLRLFEATEAAQIRPTG